MPCTHEIEMSASMMYMIEREQEIILLSFYFFRRFLSEKYIFLSRPPNFLMRVVGGGELFIQTLNDTHSEWCLYICTVI